MCQSFTVRSPLAVARVRPSGENAQSYSPSLCPFRTATCRPLDASHNRAVLSLLAVARRLWVGEKAMLLMPPRWPSSPVGSWDLTVDPRSEEHTSELQS